MAFGLMALGDFAGLTATHMKQIMSYMALSMSARASISCAIGEEGAHVSPKEGPRCVSALLGCLI